MENKKDVLQPGRHVVLTLNNGEEFEGRVKSRSGIGESGNYIPSQEIIKVENHDGNIEVSLSAVKKASEK
ncbi:MAG: hypothetical protein RSO15_18250 [Bacteroides sp.]|uniref:hypothetical protein n=1 Tax=Bacteroides sp. TaxID=29523 RepID=UPI002FCC18A5